MLAELLSYYRGHAIDSEGFACRHFGSCSQAGGRFTTAKASFVGPEYERGSLPRLLFLSLDSGSATADATARTLQAVREQELATDVSALPKGKHWYETHELAFVLLRQFKADLTVAGTSPYFAHVNSAKCCMNNPSRRQAADILFDNCRGYLPGELRILQPDIVVSQGAAARRAMEQFDVLEERTCSADGTVCKALVVRVGARHVLWLPTHHPSGYGSFWPQKKRCLPLYTAAVDVFTTARTLVGWP